MDQQPRPTELLGVVEDGVLVVDVETDGLEWWRGHRPFLIGLCSTSGRRAAVDVGDERAMAEVRRLLADPGLCKVGHNWKFDLLMLEAMGLEVAGPRVDTMLLMQLIDRSHSSYALKRLAANLLREDTGEEEELKGWLARENRRRRRVSKAYGLEYREASYADAPREMVRRYLLKDLEYTMKLLWAAGPRAAKLCPDVCRTEMQLLRVVADMEKRGTPVDVDHFRRMQRKAERELSKLEKRAHRLAGAEFGLGSSQQLADVLFNRVGLKCLKWNEPTKRHPEGSPCFDADTLPLYRHPVADTVLRYRKRKKLASTYYGPIAERAVGGVVHPSFRQLGARTGRFSCAAPNLQNIPRKDKTVRAGFVAPDGWYMLLLDYSQIEMRIFAHYAKSEALIEAILEGVDLHARTARMLFGDEADGDDALRFVGKTINFGIIYGMGRRALRKQLRKRLLEELEYADRQPSATVRELAFMSEAEAGSMLRRYYLANPDVRRFMDEVQRRVHVHGGVTDDFGRPYLIPAKKAYKGLNYLVQGTAAGVLKHAMLRVDLALARRRDSFSDRRGNTVRMVNCVHDELAFLVPNSMDPWATGRRLRGIMEDRETFAVPITVDAAWSPGSWAEKEELAA